MGLKAPAQVAHPVGCGTCNGSGFRGRLAAVEVLEPSSKLRSMIVKSEPLGELVAQARTEGFVPIIEDGLRHVAAGRTTVSEMVRVLSFEERALDLYEDGEN